MQIVTFCHATRVHPPRASVRVHSAQCGAWSPPLLSSSFTKPSRSHKTSAFASSSATAR
jgi:hypothetical protein